MLKRKSLILVKIETVSGTDSNPSPALNALLVANVDPKVNGETLERNFDRASLSPLEHIIGSKDLEVTFETELKGSLGANLGTVEKVPEIDALLLASGMERVLTANSANGNSEKNGKIIYKPSSSGHKTLTLWIYLDGILFKSNGAMGSMKIIAEAGKMPRIEWTFKGTFSTPTDAPIPGGAIYQSVKAVPFTGAKFKIGDYSAIIESLNIDLANDIQRRVDANAPEGVAGFLITGRDTQGSINPEAVIEATHPFWAKWKSGSAIPLEATIGKEAGSRLKLSAPKVQFREITLGDRSGIRTYEIPCRFAMDSGDDEFVLEYN